MTPAARSDLELYARLLARVRPMLGLFGLSLIGFLVYAGAQVAFTDLLGLTVDTIRTRDDGAAIGSARWLIPLGMVGAVAARGLGGFLGEYALALISGALVHRLRCELFEQLLVLPSSFFDRSARGHLVSRITFTVTQVSGAATRAVETLVREGLTVLALTGWLLWMNWKLTCVFLVIAPLIGAVVRMASRRFRRVSRRIQSAMGDVTHLTSEAASGWRVVRTFGGEPRERARFIAASEYSRRQTVKMAATSAISTPVVQLLVALALAVLVWLLLDPVLLGDMSAGDVVGFITAAGLMARPIRSLSEVNAVIQRGLAAAADIFAQLDEPPEQDRGEFAPARVRGHIEFRGLGFTYPGSDRPVLQSIDLDVAPGRTLALVGRSGSGKSTLVSLLPRFHEPTEGEVRLDGVVLADYRLAELRRQLALVGQQVVLFNDTVLHNIAYGSMADASREAVIEAARRAHALEFIEQLPDGLDTVIGDEGVRLSGGQRQRLAIARALLKDAPVLILDEATSALDSESEQHIQAALAEVMRGRTTVVIAHRLSTIERADEIAVLDGGRIVERGTHAALLAAGGPYATLHAHQFPDAEVDVPGSTVATGETDAAAAPDEAAAGRVEVDDRSGLEGALGDRWYGDSPVTALLAPLGAVTRWVARRRLEAGRRKGGWRAPVPVIVVGNVTVGGTGKTPLVIALVAWLRARGWHPGVVARGHGGALDEAPRQVAADSDPGEVGDEAVLVCLRTGVPVVVHPDRVAAVQRLLETGVDIVIADDGLQHHALARDLEIAVLDGARGLGNGRCLPAGPLREDAARLDEVDLLVSTGRLRDADRGRPHHEVTLRPVLIRRLRDGREWPAGAHPLPRRVHGVAGIGHPQRFFDTLAALGFAVQAHRLRDHHPFTRADLEFADGLPLVMTEKDAVKVARLGEGPQDALLGRCHALVVDAVLPPSFTDALAARLAALDGGRDRPRPGPQSEVQEIDR